MDSKPPSNPTQARRRSGRAEVDSNCGSFFPILALGALAVTAGAFHGNPFAIALGVPFLIGPFVLFRYVVACLKRVEIKRHIADAVFEGEDVEVIVRLTNHSRLPIFYPTVTDVFTPEIHAKKQVAFPFRVLAGETVEERFSGKCLLPRGVYTLDAAVVTISDPFGWVQLTRRLSQSHRLKVYPTVQDFGLPERIGAVVSALRDEFTCSRRGESLEFFSVREYRSGDPLRKVHWPLTAHLGAPVVREFAQNSVGSLNIFVDLEPAALIGIGRGSSLEYAVKVSVALASHAIRQGLRVRLFADGRRDTWALPAAGGAAQIQRVLDASAEFRPDGETPLPDLLRRHHAAIGRGDATLVFVSPHLYGSVDLVNALRAQRARGMRVVAVVFDDISFRSLRAENQPGAGARIGFSASLQAMGIETIAITAGSDLGVVFRSGGAA